jgi:hypothetical protein
MLFYGNYMRGARLKWDVYIFGIFYLALTHWYAHFKKFVDSSSWPMMQYKVSLIDSVWSFTKGPLIQLWKTNVDGSPKLPCPQPYSMSPNLGPWYGEVGGKGEVY